MKVNQNDTSPVKEKKGIKIRKEEMKEEEAEAEDEGGGGGQV